MTLLIAVLAGHLAHILGWAILVPTQGLKNVDSDSWDEAFRLSFLSAFLAMVVMVFLFLFLDLRCLRYRGLRVCLPSFLGLQFKILNPKIFQGTGLTFSFFKLWMGVLEELLVGLPDIQLRPECRLDFSVFCFLKQLLKTV